MAFLFTFLLLCAGCLPTFQNSITTPPGSEVDPTPLLGNWKVVTIWNEMPNELLIISLSLESNVLHARYQHETENVDETFTLTRVNGNILVSSKGQGSNFWNIFRLSTTALPDTLKFFGPRADSLAAHVTGGLVSGSVDSVDLADVLVQITAPGTALFSYFSAHPNLFHTDGLVLARQ